MFAHLGRTFQGARNADVDDLKAEHIGVDLRSVGDFVDRLEADSKKADLLFLFGGLADSKNAPKGGGGASAPAGQGKNKAAGASGADIANYGSQIKAAIESRFYDASSYAGKTCTLRVKMAPDGLLIDVKAEGGDPALCQAALAAARQAKFPKPPSQAVYEVFKNAPLDFKP